MRNYRKVVKRILAWVFCVALVVCAIMPQTLVLADSEEDLKDLNSQYDALKKQQDAVQAQINKTTTDKAAKVAQKKNLDNQIYLTQQQITVLLEKIQLLEDEITNKEEEITDLQESIDDNYEQYKQRLSALYRAGNPTALGAVLGAESFSDFLMQSEMLKRMATHDQSLLDNLTADRERLEEVKANLDADKEDLDASKSEVQTLQSSLSGQRSQTESEIQNISALEKELMADKAAYKSKMDAIQAEINDIYAQIGSNGEYVGGELQWPVPGYSNISSAFGWRFGGSDYHTGIDISKGSQASIYGKSIVAANSGTVAYVKNGTTGYGRYLIIDHGGGITTLYAHTSEILVQAGTFVNRGETIARVGSTGWSTGPHLHFEVRVNGTAKNPLTYLK